MILVLIIFSGCLVVDVVFIVGSVMEKQEGIFYTVGKNILFYYFAFLLCEAYMH